MSYDAKLKLTKFRYAVWAYTAACKRRSALMVVARLHDAGAVIDSRRV